MLVEWAEEQNLQIIIDVKDKGIFRSTANERGQPTHISRKSFFDFPKSQDRTEFPKSKLVKV